MTSRRLPGKVLAQLAGKPMLAHVLERLGKCKSARGLIVATSDDATDDPIEDFLSTVGVACFRGSLNDVIGRMVAAARAVNADALVRVSGDSPFIDPGVVDDAVATFLAERCDLLTNVLPRTFPYGMSVEVVATGVLADVACRDLTAAQREHVTTYFYDNQSEFGIVAMVREESLEGYRFVVDEPADLERSENLILRMGSDPAEIGLEQLIQIYDETRVADN